MHFSHITALSLVGLATSYPSEPTKPACESNTWEKFHEGHGHNINNGEVGGIYVGLKRPGGNGCYKGELVPEDDEGLGGLTLGKPFGHEKEKPSYGEKPWPVWTPSKEKPFGHEVEKPGHEKEGFGGLLEGIFEKKEEMLEALMGKKPSGHEKGKPSYGSQSGGAPAVPWGGVSGGAPAAPSGSAPGAAPFVPWGGAHGAPTVSGVPTVPFGSVPSAPGVASGVPFVPFGVAGGAPAGGAGVPFEGGAGAASASGTQGISFGVSATGNPKVPFGGAAPKAPATVPTGIPVLPYGSANGAATGKPTFPFGDANGGAPTVPFGAKPTGSAVGGALSPFPTAAPLPATGAPKPQSQNGNVGQKGTAIGEQLDGQITVPAVPYGPRLVTPTVSSQSWQ